MKARLFSRRWLLAQGVFAASYSLCVIVLLILVRGGAPRFLNVELSLPRLVAALLPATTLGLGIYLILGSAGMTRIPRWPCPSEPGDLRTLNTVHRVGLFCIGLAILALAVPNYRLGESSELYQQCRPLMAWIGLVGLQTVTAMPRSATTVLTDRIRGRMRDERGTLLLGAGILLSVLVAWIFVAATGIGVRGHEDYWYEAGVPLLVLHVFVAVVVGYVIFLLEDSASSGFKARFDLWVFAAAWVITAAMWITQPETRSYFNPAPRPPTQEMLPFSDSATYDLKAQFADFSDLCLYQLPERHQYIRIIVRDSVFQFSH